MQINEIFKNLPTGLSVQIGPGEGQLYVKFKGVTNNHGYEIWFGRASVAPNSWTEMMGVSSGRKRCSMILKAMRSTEFALEPSEPIKHLAHGLL